MTMDDRIMDRSAAATGTAEETGAGERGEDILLGRAPSEELMAKADIAAGLMKALSNPCRLLILCMLSDGEKTVSELEQHLHTKQPNVSQQLARLRHEGLVGARREGRMMYYHLADDRVRGVLSALYSAYCATDPAEEPSDGT